MKSTIGKAAVIASSALALAALAPSAQAALSPGNYSVAGIQNICLVSDGTWYGENFPSWGGGWEAGPTKDDATVLWGTYNSGAGEDTMVFTRSAVDWTEFHNDRTFVNFIDGAVTRIHGKCTPPAASATTRKNPMD